MKTILVVDDEPAIRELIADVLREEGYALAVANDGIAALDMLPETRADLIVTDIMMPRLDGVGLIRRLRERPDLRDIRVIVMSAGTLRDLTGLGVAAYLQKPFDLLYLLAIVSDVLDGASPPHISPAEPSSDPDSMN